MIQFLHRLGAFFELRQLFWVDRRLRNQLQPNRFMGAGVNRLIIDRRAGPADFPARFARANAVMFEKGGGFHSWDGPIATILTMLPQAELRETFFGASFSTSRLLLVSCG